MPKKKRHFDKVRGWAWVTCLQQKSGWSLNKLDVHFRKLARLPGNPGLTQGHTNYLSKIKEGQFLPTYKRKRAGDMTIAELAEESFPGSIIWLQHPLFDLMERSHSFAEILALPNIPPAVMKRFKSLISIINASNPRDIASLRKQISDELTSRKPLSSMMHCLYFNAGCTNIFKRYGLHERRNEAWYWIVKNVDKAIAEDPVLKTCKDDLVRRAFHTSPAMLDKHPDFE